MAFKVEKNKQEYIITRLCSTHFDFINSILKRRALNSDLGKIKVIRIEGEHQNKITKEFGEGIHNGIPSIKDGRFPRIFLKH